MEWNEEHTCFLYGDTAGMEPLLTLGAAYHKSRNKITFLIKENPK